MISILARLFYKMNFASLARFSNYLPCSLILFSFVVVPASGVENGQFSAFTFSHRGTTDYLEQLRILNSCSELI